MTNDKDFNNTMRLQFVALFVLSTFSLAGCSQAVTQSVGGMMPGMGPGAGMMARHHATIPEDYAGVASPIEATDESLMMGEAIFTNNCATCHGDGGMGDGPGGQALDPAPAPVAHSSQMLGDDYLFWRVSEGGGKEPFKSAMPGYKATLSEEERWHVINYVRALGSGQVMPRENMGGQAFDPAFELRQREAMLKQAVSENVLTMQEAEVFDQVHDAMDEMMASGEMYRGGGMGQMQLQMVDELVAAGTITQEQGDTFNAVHDKLLESGLMQ
jgi:mono/diheme cytochrome c family protein/polyhydroxyalkanoate synthesis regulator phasin